MVMEEDQRSWAEKWQEAIERRKMRRSKTMEGLARQDMDFVLDTGVHWEPVVGYEERHHTI